MKCNRDRIVLDIADTYDRVELIIEKEDSPVLLDIEDSNESVILDLSDAVLVDKSYNPYEGDYEVVSKLYNPQTMETQGKVMAHDTVVKPIPIYEVSNPAGGMTVTIGD